MSMFQLFRPALFALDPEVAHHATIEGLKTASCLGLTSLVFKRPANDPRTVITTLRILETKGYVRHTKEGRAFTYQPLVGRDEGVEPRLPGVDLCRQLLGLGEGAVPPGCSPDHLLLA